MWMEEEGSSQTDKIFILLNIFENELKLQRRTQGVSPRCCEKNGDYCFRVYCQYLYC